MSFNKNNYLIWDAQFEDAPYVASALGTLVTAPITATQATFAFGPADVATYGINLNTFVFTLQDAGAAAPAVYDAATGYVTYYLPAAPVVGFRTLKYQWQDNAGNLSNEGTISIELTARATAWRPNPASLVCRVVAGDNTGYAGWGLLEEYYTDDSSTVLPLNTKPNVIGDPDYVADYSDPVMCPLPSAVLNLNIYNVLTYGGPTPPTIVSVQCTKTAGTGTGTVILVNPNMTPSDPQPYTVPLSPGTWDVEVTLANILGADLVLWAYPGGAGGAWLVGVVDGVHNFVGFVPGTAGAGDLILQP